MSGSIGFKHLGALGSSSHFVESATKVGSQIIAVAD